MNRRHFLTALARQITLRPNTDPDHSRLVWFGFVGNEALSACKTIAELWDDRLGGGGDIGLVSAAG